MPVIDDKMDVNPKHEDVEIEDKTQATQAATRNDEKKEDMQGIQEIEKYEGGSELQMNNQQEANDNKIQEKKDGEEKVKYFEGSQESSEPGKGEDEEDIFKGTEEETGLQNEHLLAREQDVNEKINHDRVEHIHVNKKLREENQASEDGKGQAEISEIATEIHEEDGLQLGNEVKLNQKEDGEESKEHTEGTRADVKDHSQEIVLQPSPLSPENPFEKMLYEACEDHKQKSVDSGIDKDKQLEGRKGPSEALEDHNETGLATSVETDGLAVQCIAGTPLSHSCNTPETYVQDDHFLHSDGVEAKSSVMEMNRAEDISVEPSNFEDSAVSKELDIEGENKEGEESGNKHLESLGTRANLNADERNSEGNDWEAGKFNGSGEEFQGESEQELFDKGARDIVQEAQTVDDYLANQDIKDAKNGQAIAEVEGKVDIPFDTISEPSSVNDEKQVVVEAIPMEIEEKVILDDDGKQNDHIQQQDASTTEIHEAFNNTDGREKKPVPDAVLADESSRDKKIEWSNYMSRSMDNPQSDIESAEDESEEDEENNETSPTLPAKTAGSTVSNGTTSSSSSGLSLPARPAGLGSSVPLLGPAPRAVQHSRANGTSASRTSQLAEDQTNGDSDENNETREKLQMIRVKFLRLAHRLGQTPHNVVVAQVLYRLGLAEQLRGSRNSSRTGPFSFDRASSIAEQQEAVGREGLDFTCTIMVLGKTGVGKSATINSVFDEVRSGTSAFQLGTKRVQEIVGTVQGIRIRVIDTPGLLASSADQHHNEKILRSVKRFIKKTPPDIVLYFDRLDMQSRDSGDLPLLRTITEIFSPAVWFNAIIVLTHAASAPPEGPNGIPLSYEMFVSQRSHVVQQAIRQAAGDMRLMNPVSLVENHSACRTNRAGQRVLPNGQIWKPQLLLLCFASKILAEANALLKLQDSPTGKAYGTRPRVPPLPFLLSSLLQSRALPAEQQGDEDSDEELDDSSDSEDESEYDKLPPFRYLNKSELNNLSKEMKDAYYSELEEREKLFMKKQLKEERKHRRFMKKKSADAQNYDDTVEENPETDNIEGENLGPEPVLVEMPDMALPPSFDADNPSYRYRYHDASNQGDQWLVRPVLETHGWDHDVGYEGVNVEKMFVIGKKIPISLSGQVTKDKKESNLQMECATSLKHGEGKSTLAGLDVQTVGKDLAYSLRSETRFSNFKHNKTTAGLAITLLGDAIAAGMKLEDRLMIGKRLKLVLNGGAITGRGDVAYGGSIEASLRDEDYPIVRSLSTLGLSLMDWHGDLAIGCNLQSQFPVGRKTNMTARANLNNRGAGQISIRTSSSDQLQLALIGIIPILRTIGNRLTASQDHMQ
uniref:TSA: Wollemia nobilis Ref_Wollemi_Transcript_25292_4634 transcribed RNA sequence n=1 Tax=Wollemia nobilis TaxID=56998 RepID=A0A0C9S4E5_9CONI